MIRAPLELACPDGRKATVLLSGAAAAGTLTADAAGVAFDLPEGAHVYLTSKGDTNFALPPAEPPVPLAPDTTYRIRGELRLAGGRAGLWLIEYDQHARLGHHQRALSSRPLALTWRTSPRHASWCLALRLSGTGRLNLGPLALTPATPRGEPPAAPAAAGPPTSPPVAAVRTGPAGAFRADSTFFDPAGADVEEEWPAGRDADWPAQWLAEIAGRLAGCAAVLHVGCGSGRLLAALRSAGAADVLGLEWEAGSLSAARARGAAVLEHDPGEP